MLTIFQGGQNKAGQFPGAGKEQQVELQTKVRNHGDLLLVESGYCCFHI